MQLRGSYSLFPFRARFFLLCTTIYVVSFLNFLYDIHIFGCFVVPLYTTLQLFFHLVV